MTALRDWWSGTIILALIVAIPILGHAQERSELIKVAAPLTYIRVYADSLGASHFAADKVDFTLVDYAPPAPAISVSEVAAAQGVIFLSSPSGWFGDWHPAPRRQYIFCMSGEIEVEVSNGEIRRFGPGSIILVEDTVGQGHITRVVSAERAYLVAVSLTGQ